MKKRFRPHVAGIIVAWLTAGCATPRPQIVVFVDTDAPLPGQVIASGADGPISLDAIIDTVAIERLDDDGSLVCIDKNVCIQQLVLPDPASWPFSFGVETPPGGGGTTLHLRVRAFASASASPGTAPIGGTGMMVETTVPPAWATIDRLVDLVLPETDAVTVKVSLAADCRNVPVKISKTDPQTCIADPMKPGAPGDGIDTVPTGEPVGPSHAGTWAWAESVGCSTDPSPGRACVPGGFSVMGDAQLTGVDPVLFTAAFPPRPVYVSPFFMDTTEFTVGRFRRMLAAGAVADVPDDPLPPDPTNAGVEQCTWLGITDAEDDDFPLTCLTWQRAREICHAAGGDLPTEAQWEHAARGRGQGRTYPWGAQAPSCCTASLDRASTDVPTTPCPGFGPEQVRSHLPSPTCGGLGDESRDGILDLGGSVSELCRDSLVAYSEGCWEQFGILKDPLCTGASAHASRGGDWSEGIEISMAALRRGDVVNDSRGFRCVYADGAL